MMITDVFPNAESEFVILFLLTAYIEATQFAGKIPEHLTNLPITGLEDVETRFQQLIMEYDKAFEKQHDKACVEIEEALRIFDAALCRLKFLEREKELLASNLSGDSVRTSSRKDRQIGNSKPAAHAGSYSKNATKLNY